MCTLISPNTLNRHTATPSLSTTQHTHPIQSNEHTVSHCLQDKAHMPLTEHYRPPESYPCLTSLFHLSTHPHPHSTLHIQNLVPQNMLCSLAHHPLCIYLPNFPMFQTLALLFLNITPTLQIPFSPRISLHLTTKGRRQNIMVVYQLNLTQPI